MPQLVDHRGNPLALSPQTNEAPAGVLRAWNAFLGGLANTEQTPMQRARDPFGNHVWVYSAVMSIAVNSSQVPYEVYKDGQEAKPGKLKEDKAVHRTARYGFRRTAKARYLNKTCRRNGLRIRGVEQQFDHPIADLIYRPNPLMSEAQLWETISMWMSLRGACFLLKTRKDGSPVAPGELPDFVWPLCPDLFSPWMEGDQFLGWNFTPSYNDVTGYGVNLSKFTFNLMHHEVIQFKYPNPADPLGWVSPITAAAAGISMDMAAVAYNRAVLLNGAKPGGLLLHEDEIDEKEEKKLRQYWKDRHEGPQNANKMAILTGSFKYVDIGLGPKDMEYLEQRRWDREEIFAALRVTKSSMSLSEGLSYATQLSQDRNYWDKCLMPLMRMYEDVLDRTLFYNEPDTVFGAFDFSKVEALRAGLNEKVDIVVKLTGPQVRMPPSVAFEVVGLDVPSYEGDDVALIPTALGTVEDVIAGKFIAPPPSSGTNSDPTSPKSQDPATGQPESDNPNPDTPPKPADSKDYNK